MVIRMQFSEPLLDRTYVVLTFTFIQPYDAADVKSALKSNRVLQLEFWYCVIMTCNGSCNLIPRG